MAPITDKQKCIVEQSVYGDLKISTIGGIRKCYGYNGYRVIHQPRMGSVPSIDSMENIKPILRPLSWLTREITHEGYNDNKPFVPLIELAKIAQGATSTDHFKLVNDTVVDFTIAYHFKQNVMWFQSLQGKKQVYIISKQNLFFDLLNQLHFDTRRLIDKGDAVSTEEVGDMYAVKKLKHG